MNRLPVINLVESGGADLPTQAELFVPGGRIFRDLTQLSAAGHPDVALVFGNSTAGGAYVPGMCDYAVLVDGAGQGVPRRPAAGEDGDRRGRRRRGARRRRRCTPGCPASPTTSPSTSSTRSGIGREIVAHLNWRKLGPAPRPARRAALRPRGAARHRRPPTCRCRSTRARSSPGSSTAREFDEFKPLYGTALVTGWAQHPRLPGRDPRQRTGRAVQRGGAEGQRSSSSSPTRPTRRWCSCRTPPATWSARELRAGRHHQGRRQDDQRGDQLDGAAPHDHHRRARTAPATTACAGRAYDPRFLFAWPNAKLAVMGPAQLAGVLSIVGRAVRRGARAGRSTRRPTRAMRAAIEDQIEARVAAPFFVTARLYDDGDHRPARHPHRARHRACRPCHTQRGRRAPRLRRLPDVSGCDQRDHEAARRQPRRDRPARHPHLRARSASPPSRCSPTPTPTRRYVARGRRGGPAARRRAGRHLPARRPDPRRGRGRPAPTPSTPATASCPRTPASPAPCVDAGLTFVGPPPEAIAAMGVKLEAQGAHGRRRACRCCPALTDAGDRRPTAAPIGFPVLVKASAGGGGRGMRIVRDPDELAEAVASARARGGVGVRRRHGVPRALRRATPATSRSRSSATRTATSCTCSSASARSSAATRRSSRRRRRRRSTTTLRGALGAAAVAAARGDRLRRRGHRRVRARRRRASSASSR